MPESQSTSLVIRALRGWFFTFEVKTAQARALLPARLRPLETRRGVSLINVNVIELLEGGCGIHLPHCWDIDFGVQIKPDNSRFPGMPEPAFCAYPIRVASTSNAYLDLVGPAGYPLHRSTGVAVRCDDRLWSVEVADDQGPIASLRPSRTNPAPGAIDLTGQELIRRDGRPHRTNWRYLARGVFLPGGGTGTSVLYNHPFFTGLSFPEAGPVCARQLLQQPGVEASSEYFRPQAAPRGRGRKKGR